MSDVQFPMQPLSALTIAIKDGTHGTHRRVAEGVPLLSAKNISANGEITLDDSDDLISESEYLDLTRSFRLEPDDLLLTIVGSLGRRAIYSGQRITFQRSVAYIRPQQTKSRSRFLFHWMGHPAFSGELARRSNATAQAGLYLGELAKVSVPVPKTGEQEAIAQILDTLDTAIHETEAIIAKLKAVKQGLLHDLLTRGIDANGELRPPQAEAPHLYKESSLGWIPGEWDIRNLCDCAEIASGVTLGRSLTGHGLVELPYLRVANVQDGYVDLSDVKTVRVLRNEVERFALADGDVLMNEGGDYDKLGRGTVWRAQIQPCLHQNHVFRVRCDRDVLAPDYLAAYSASPRGKTFFILSSKQSTNLASINSTQLKAFPIVCPRLSEQRQVIERLDNADGRVSLEESELQKLRALKSGLMDDLLTGRVRVTPLLEDAAP